MLNGLNCVTFVIMIIITIIIIIISLGHCSVFWAPDQEHLKHLILPVTLKKGFLDAFRPSPFPK